VGDVAVFHDVTFAFGAELSGGFDGGFGLVLPEVRQRVNLGADEAALEVGVDDARRLRRCGADRNFPGTDLLGAGGEKRVQAQELLRLAGERRERGLFEAHAFEHFLLVGLA
jgi:hypothetical protein